MRITYSSSLLARFKQSLDDVNNYMHFRNLPPNIRRRVNQFFDNKFKQKRVGPCAAELCADARQMFEEIDILRKLSHPLRKEILRHVVRGRCMCLFSRPKVQDLMRKVPFFQQQLFVTGILAHL